MMMMMMMMMMISDSGRSEFEVDSTLWFCICKLATVRTALLVFAPTKVSDW